MLFNEIIFVDIRYIRILIKIFNDYFGFKIPNYKFAEKLKSANVWDDIVTDSMDEYMDSLIDFSEMSDDDLFSEEFI